MSKKINDRIKDIEVGLEGMDPSSKGYTDAAANLVRLYEARSKNFSLLSGDAILGAVTSILGILLVLYFEKTDIVVTKAMSLIKRP